MKGVDNVFRFYIANDEYRNYLIVQDTRKTKNNTAIINWDFDAYEMEDTCRQFMKNGDSDKIISACACCKPNWKKFDTVINQYMNNVSEIIL